MTYELIKGNSYVIEWKDSTNYAGWHDKKETEAIVAKEEDLIVTRGVYLGKLKGQIYISMAQNVSENTETDSNVIKIAINSISASQCDISLSVSLSGLKV
jgi:hypothetical protein